MQVTTLSFGNMHNHGELFSNMLRARHETFIQQNKWDLPEADGMEFDQYDTPASRWIAVHRVRARARGRPADADDGAVRDLHLHDPGRAAGAARLDPVEPALRGGAGGPAHLGILAHLRVASGAREPADAGADRT
jgi:hypothetical protein